MTVKAEKNAHDDRKLEERELERQRAMILGRFSFIDEVDKSSLDDSVALAEVVKEWKASLRDERKRLRIQYESNRDDVADAADAADAAAGAEEGPKSGTDSVARPKSVRRAKGYDGVNLPKAGESFVVVWVTTKGQVVVDKDVMLLNMKEVVKTRLENPDVVGPKGPRFAWVLRGGDSDSDSSTLDFDVDLFWSVGFLFKHFKTCGLQRWDKQMALLRKELRTAESASGAAASNSPSAPGKRRRRRSDAGGKYFGRLVGWKGTYGFLQCTSGDREGDTVFLHHTDIVSPYLNLARGLQFRFDVVAESGLGDARDGKLRAVRATPCLCNFSCSVHRDEAGEEGKEKKGVDKPRRRRRSSKSSKTAPHSNSGVEGEEIGGGAGDAVQRAKGEKRRRSARRINRRPRQKAEVEA